MSNTIKAKTYTVAHFNCPTCGQTHHSYQHLLDEAVKSQKPVSFGPWRCHECISGYTGVVNPDGTVLLTPYKNNFIRAVSLLKSQHEEHPIYLMVEMNHCHPDPSKPLDPSYYFDQHTCPTNYMRDVTRILFDGDTDPHGVFEHVRTVTAEEARKIIEALPAEVRGQGTFSDDIFYIFPETRGISE